MDRKIAPTLLPATCILLSFNTFAAGFQVNEHSASGLGRAFAGEAAIADNAASLAHNPASMTRFDRMQIAGALTLLNPEVDIETLNTEPPQRYNDIAPFAAIPASYFIQPVNDQWAWGLALFSSYGVATEYPTEAHFGSLAGKTDLLTININPNLAWRINEHLSVGAGVSLVYADAELKRHFGGLSTAYGISPSQDLVKMTGDTWEWGWNAGILWELNANHRFGLNYRSQVDLDFSGEFVDSQGASIPGASSDTPQKTTSDLTVVLPAIAEFSGYHQFTSQWALHYSIQWSQWSEFKELRATSKECRNSLCLLKEEDFDDSFRYSIGATYFLSPQWTLRAGYSYDEQAGAATLSIPDASRYWYATGATYRYTSQWSFDVGIMYIRGKRDTFTETYVDGQEYQFRSAKSDAWAGSAQVNYTF